MPLVSSLSRHAPAPRSPSGPLNYDEIYCRVGAQREGRHGGRLSARALAGKRSFCAMKHVGLNVAADPLFTSVLHRRQRRHWWCRGRRPGHALLPERAGLPPLRRRRQDPHAGTRRTPPECQGLLPSGPSSCPSSSTPRCFLQLCTRISHSQSIVELGQRVEPALAAL